MEINKESVLKKALTQNEYESLETALRGKIETVLDEHIQDYLTAKACFQTTRTSLEARIADLEAINKNALQDRDELKTKWEGIVVQYDDMNKRLSVNYTQLNKYRDDIQRLEKQLETVRRERNEAVDEKQVTSSMLERRQAEVERLNLEITSLNTELRSSNHAKLEALTMSEDVQAKLIELEYREKRVDKERTLLTRQMDEMTADLSRANEELAKQKRESTSNQITLQTKISELEEELRITHELNEKLTSTNEDLHSQLEEVTKKLKDQMATEDRLIETFQNDLKAQSKLTDLYKERVEEAEHRAGELSAAVKELQRLLKEASDHSGDLETRLVQQETDSTAELESKQDAINALKEELRHANILLEAVKQESSEAAVSRLSPMAASASKLLKSGLTLTQLYTKYAETIQELLVEKQEREQLKEYIDKILKEIEDKSPIIAKQQEDYAHALNSMETLAHKVDDLENEQVRLRRSNTELEATNNYLARENKKNSGTINDLGRQVCLLLREVEAARGNHIALHDTSPERRAEARTTSEVITKHLVTFKDLKDLQLTNQKLLAAIRELGESQENVEFDKENEKVKALKSEIERAEGKIDDFIEREKFLQKEIEVIKNQRDVYERLYKQHLKPGLNSEGDMSTGISPNLNEQNEKLIRTPTKPKPTVEEEKSFKFIFEELKKEYSTYREDMKGNEKMLNETITNLREDLSKMVRSKAEVSSQAEFYQEKVKALAKKVETLTAEVGSLEKRCQNYVNTIGKHEFNIQHLRNEAMEAINKLSLAETQVNNLTQENRVLKDSERRLKSARETEKKEKHGQELLMANLETLKAKFESAEVESRIRLEARLDDANVECANLRRRLQDEQDRLTRRVELLEEQTRTAKTRLEEERNLKAKVVDELESLRNEMRSKEEKIEEMQEQLTTAINSSQPVLERESRIKELEIVINEKDATIKSLNERLVAAKRCQTELSEVSQGIEKQLTELTEQYEQHKQESDKLIEDFKKTEADLKGANLTLELKLKTSNAEETEVRAQREAELSSLRSKCEGLSTDLEKTKEKEINLEKTMKEAVRSAQIAEEKASNSAIQTNQLRQELDTLRAELVEARNAHVLLDAEHKRGLEKSKMDMASLVEKVAVLEKVKLENEERIQEFTNVNDLLHEQIQELGQKVSILNDARDTGMELDSESLTSNNARESDKMLQILRLLRKEKAAAVANAEFLKNEKQRIEVELAVLKKQIDGLKESKEQSESKESTPIAAERHTQLLAKVETLNELTENNRLLREDRDRLTTRLADVEKQLAALESDVAVPYKQKVANLEAQVEQLQTENIALKAENQRWKDRTNELIEKHNKNPDEMKRLLLEKDNLTKQLGVEKDQHKTTKTKLEELLLHLKKEKDEIIAAHNVSKEALNTCKQELATEKANCAKFTDKISKLEHDLASQETALVDLRSKELQIRQIAKKYKIQYHELQKTLEEKNKAGPSQAVIQEAEERIKQLNAQVVMALEAENELLRRENETLKSGVVEREERAKTLLKNARARVQTLSEENKSLSKELADSRRNRGPGESSVLDSTQTRNLENRISRLEKEKEDEVNEKDRVVRELEILTQRLGIVQRQLEKYQQGAKPSTSGSEKSSSETPTANIKPLSGPTTSTTKQTQLAQAVTVMPWRETPFASIRPMASQPRTVVVLPPRQSGSSTSSQPVLVAPQQQVVHTSSTCEGLSSSPTSSHIDYMPATSCAALNIHQNSNLSVIIGQHMEAEAGSEDTVPPAPTHHVAPNQNAAVALVLPQPAAQQPSQAQGEAASTESVSSVVSASNQEQLSEQSVSASNHSSIGIVWSRNVEEAGGAVASSQIEQGPSSIASGSGPNQQGCSTIAASSQQAASSTTSVTTSVAPVLKRPTPSLDDADSKPHMPVAKRSRLLVSQGEGSGEMLLRSDGLEVEYQVPTSSQRDQEDDILVISDDEDLPDDGAMDEGQEFEEEGEEEARYGIEAYGRDGQDIASYEEGDGPDIDEGNTTDQDNNEVDIIEDSNEVPNQCESTRGGVLPSVAGGSGSIVEGSTATGGEATSSLGSTTSSQDYQGRRRHHMVLSYEDPGDDSIVPSTPTLFVPRRADGFGEAVSSPHVPSARFTFADPTSVPTRIPVAGVAQVASEGMDDTRMDLSQLEEGTGRTVPTTPSHISPQDSSGTEIGQSSTQDLSIPVSAVLSTAEGSATVPDAPLSDQQENITEDVGDGVSSEGEKMTSTPPGLVVLQASSDADPELDDAEGREAEASPTAPRLSTVTATSSSPGRGNTARRTVRMGVRNHGVSSRGGSSSGRSSAPMPIVWGSGPSETNQTSQPQLPMPQQTVTMAPMRENLFMGGPGWRGMRPERPSSGFRGRARRPRMSPYHSANFGPRF